MTRPKMAAKSCHYHPPAGGKQRSIREGSNDKRVKEGRGSEVREDRGLILILPSSIELPAVRQR